MPKVALYNVKGEKIGDIELKEDIFGAEINETAMHDVVVMQLANRRLGTHDTKTRAEVSGGGKKPWRQKGTGRARAGSTRSPIWRTGGIVFGPHPRSYKYTMPKKIKRVAIKSALSSKVKSGGIIVLDELSLQQPKTKDMVAILSNLNIDKKALVVTAGVDVNVVKSARNIPGVTSTFASSLNVYDILNHDKLVITRDAVSKVEEVLA